MLLLSTVFLKKFFAGERIRFMKNTNIAAITILFLLIMAPADALEFEVGANVWQQDYGGAVQSGLTKIDLQSDLGFAEETSYNFYFNLEHSFRFIPNFLLLYTEMDSASTSTINRDIDFEDIIFPVGTTITTEFDLSHTDATFYYPVLDNRVSIDLGITLRSFHGGMSISEPTAGESELDADVVIPMLYSAVKFELPLSGLYVSAGFNGVIYDDNTLFDYSISVDYEISSGLGFELGYRSFEIDYEDDEFENADLTIDGIYAGVFYRF